MDVSVRLSALLRLFARLDTDNTVYDYKALRIIARQKQSKRIRPQVAQVLKHFKASIHGHEKRARENFEEILMQGVFDEPAVRTEDMKTQSIDTMAPSPFFSIDSSEANDRGAQELIPPLSPRPAAIELFSCSRRGIKRKRANSIQKALQVSNTSNSESLNDKVYDTSRIKTKHTNEQEA